MNWRLIDKSQTPQPRGRYPDWKQLLRAEAAQRCVYCAIHEAAYGGYRNFHIDHYRPKSRPEFEHLTHRYENLFYSCAICNGFKKDTWPADPHPEHSVAAFIDPSLVDYAGVFEVSGQSFVVEGRNVAARFMVEQLYLNRAQLIQERELVSLRKEVEAAAAAATSAIVEWAKSGLETARDSIAGASILQTQIVRLLAQLDEVAPYEPVDVQRKPRRRRPRQRRPR